MKKIILAVLPLIMGMTALALLAGAVRTPLSRATRTPLTDKAPAAHPPLAGTRWKGDLHLESPTPAIMDFHGDTVAIFNAQTQALIEIMTYTVRDSVFTIRKLSGQSDCDNVVAGRYRFSISGQGMDVHLVADSCDDRSMALTDTHWEKAR